MRTFEKAGESKEGFGPEWPQQLPDKPTGKAEGVFAEAGQDHVG